jgi:hypothetical protein
MPFVAHFRIASIGGVKPELTHPFIVDSEVPLPLEGRTQGQVLFHNGHWSNWNEKCLEAAIRANVRLPEEGPWSDTRGMAFLVSLYGKGVMDMLTSQKGVVFAPDKTNIYTGNGWEDINGVWCSNDYFWGRHRHTSSYSSYTARVCRAAKCRENAAPGKDYCSKCESKQQDQKVTVIGHLADRNATQNTQPSTKPSEVEIVTGGSRNPLARTTFTLAEVMRMSAKDQKLVSKNMVKRYRKFTSQINDKHQSKAKRAKKELEKMSEEIASRLGTGSRH